MQICVGKAALSVWAINIYACTVKSYDISKHRGKIVTECAICILGSEVNKNSSNLRNSVLAATPNHRSSSILQTVLTRRAE
jgi:hypothetical protein